jgi:hypothetical protein
VQQRSVHTTNVLLIKVLQQSTQRAQLQEK